MHRRRFLATARYLHLMGLDWDRNGPSPGARGLWFRAFSGGHPHSFLKTDSTIVDLLLQPSHVATTRVDGYLLRTKKRRAC